jgi:hypothetical protein
MSESQEVKIERKDLKEDENRLEGNPDITDDLVSNRTLWIIALIIASIVIYYRDFS